MASSAASASSTNILDSLPARPPTPPREALREADISLKSVVRRTLAFDPRLSLHTPPNANSPTSPAATGSDPSSSRIRKKVGWSAHTDYREPPQYHDGLKPNKFSPLSTLSQAPSKPVKGILKLTSSPNSLASLTNEFNGSSLPLNIIEMLDSTIKQLAGSDRESKLDAYMMLSRALKASNNLPDRVALQDKMSLFMQFIQRDMTAKAAGGNSDSSLVNHSLTLLATFLHFPAIASTLTTDFGTFVMDHSIRSFEDDTIPKDVVRHLMQVVAFQNFSAKVMTSDRVVRLLTALHNIENHVKGKSIVMSRLHIYKRLVKQSRIHMATSCDWLKDMFTDMLSTVKDIRLQAIGLGSEAGFTLRSEKQLMRKVTEIFQAANDNETYIDFYIKRLQEMMKGKQTCSVVPQIWSVTILFLRCPLDRWQYYGPWLTLVQSAFNMTDSSTKQEANFAWNRYICLSLSDTTISSKTIGTLCQPLLSQLRRKTSPKQREEAMRLRKVVIGGICNLYYYAFSPGSDRCVPDVVWDAAVQPVISQLVSLDDKPDVVGDGVMQAIRLLIGLLDVTTPRIWRQDRIIDLPPVNADELPAIDPKWIRKNCCKVMGSIRPIFQKKFRDLANKDSLVCRLWQALVGSVTVASAKDIKVSEDTAIFVGCAFGLLSTVLQAEASKVDRPFSDTEFLTSVSNYSRFLIDGLGILPFTEKRLSMTVPNTFEPILTPSQRLDKGGKSQGVVRMPLQHLFVMLSTVSGDGVDYGNTTNFFHSVFEPFLRGRNAKSQLDLTIELLHLIPKTTLSPVGPWILTADCAKAFLETCSSQPSSVSDKMLGPIYREITSLLERGLTSHPGLPSSQWVSLIHSLIARIARDFGDAGCSLIVIEPLAKTICDITAANPEKPDGLTFQAIDTIFNSAKVPRDRQALESARSRLWGAPASSTKVGQFGPFDMLYKLGNKLLTYLYKNHDGADLPHPESACLINALDKFLENNWPQTGLSSVTKLQKGLDVWIQDERTQLRPDSQAFNAVTAIWDHICTKIATQERSEWQDMDQIESLLTLGFKSKQATIVNRTAVALNIIMKENKDLKCSDNFETAISSIRSNIDIFLPTGSKIGNDFGAQIHTYAQLHNDANFMAASLQSSKRNAGDITAFPTVATLRRPITRKRRQELTPELTRERPVKRTSTPRLRHEDSQIQFEPVASSSPLQDESQHLTERQREVRERQRETTALYSEAQSASPVASAQSLPKTSKERDVNVSHEPPQESTPKHSKSFEDLISSTPTPRRGQILQLEDFNDPPSSPPLPRPYPLLSEIQSRSRTDRPLESWEFSSPPGSPTVTTQREEAELPPTTEEAAGQRTKSLRSTKKQRQATIKARQSADRGISPGPVDDNSDIAKVDQEPKVLPSIDSRATFGGITTRARTANGTPKAEEAASTKSIPLSRRRSLRHIESDAKSENPTVKQDPDLRIGAVASPTPQADDIIGSDPQPQPAQCLDTNIINQVEPHECIMVHTGSSCPSPGNAETAVDRVLSPFVPSTPAESVEKAISSGSRRKRKRGSKGGESCDKRRRSIENPVPESPTPAVTRASLHLPISEDANAQLEGIRTRISLRKRQQHASSDAIERMRKETRKQAPNLRKNMDSGDTDEEVNSQLATESHAASQQSQPHHLNTIAMLSEGLENEPRADVKELEVQSELDQSLAKVDGIDARASPLRSEETMSIMETLRNGLEQLRSISLTRERVYEVEDILMDMKRELFEAERRGRCRGRTRKRKSKTH
ncbi:hypothetical protein QQS21_003205 [Conoideocrella luteorostrata]|uniref:Telomere-associated protein Rif1 N-terminal domain-containing protein n=1 Tax=Conoideocrella luteorostrata TaxID=1105319 RepID=A0AAJ0CTP6_9HYPO|nr:hypothetical protein QQS21_003205 [Conoideocrella luteorostrata]